LICRAVVTSKLGKVLIAVRDAESRTRFLGYRVESYKLFVFTLSACMAGVAGALYVPQVGIINPGEFAPGNSIEAVIWVAVGAIVVNYAKTVFTSGPLAPYWLFMLGALFILVTLLLPKGIIGTFNAWWEPGRARRKSAIAESAAREDGVSEPNMAEGAHERHGHPRHPRAALSRRRARLVRRLSRHQQSVADARPRRDACDHRPERRRQDHDDGHHHRQDQAGPWHRAVRRRHRPYSIGRNTHCRTRHRPQIPEADSIREPDHRGQSAAGAQRRSQ